MNIAASQQDASAEDRKLMLLVQEFQKRASAFTFSEYTEDRQKCIRQFIALTAQFSPQLRGVIVNLGAGDEMVGWEELFSDVSVAWDYDARLQGNKPDAIELKRICHEIGPEVLRRVISLLLLALASKMVLREAYYGEEAEDDKDYVRDIATINEVSGQIEYGGGLAFLLKVAERERIGDTSELLDEFLVTSTIFYQILGSPEFDLHGAFDEFEKTLRRSVRLPYKKHAVSLLIDELSKRKSKFVFASDPDKSNFVSFLDQSLKECWTINSGKRDRVVFRLDWQLFKVRSKNLVIRRLMNLVRYFIAHNHSFQLKLMKSRSMNVSVDWGSSKKKLANIESPKLLHRVPLIYLPNRNQRNSANGLVTALGCLL